METNKIYQGDCLEILKTFPDESVNCIATSPPYWAVRDYGVKKQIGLEEHPQQYIDKIVEIMKECKRIITKDGTIFLNLGDSFYTRSGSGQGSNFKKTFEELDGGAGKLHEAHSKTRGKYKTNWLQSKQKLLIPYRIAIKCQDDLGLILRNDIHWIKQFVDWGTKESYGTSYPSSVKDRLNTNSEVIFFFTKSKDYYFNLDAIRVPHKKTSLNRIKYGHKSTEGSPYAKQCDGKNLKRFCHPNGKNPGDCIRFPFDYSREPHFAVFPKSLPEFCISCGCPENGIVCDIFAGTGTTLLVSKNLSRRYIGIELNKKYIKLINKKLSQPNKKEEILPIITTK